MNKQQQDKLWSELSEESKKNIKNKYADVKDENRELYDYEDRVEKRTMEDIFGSHNLNPQSQIKTWEDIEKSKYLGNKFNLESLSLEDTDFYRGANTLMPDNNEIKLKNKLIATYKIAKLIELGYGGMITDEEWKDEYMAIWYIDYAEKLEIYSTFRDYRNFIAFHERSQAEEFMSYESNRLLVQQYFMM